MAHEPLVLDVRPVLASGGHPMQTIMQAVERLHPGQALRLIAPFRPEPLFRMLDQKGYDAHPVDQPNGDCVVLFTARNSGETEGEESSIPSPLAWPDPERHFDLTELDDKAAVSRVLAALDDMVEGSVLFALFSREPDFLYSDLTRRQHRWVGNFDQRCESYRMLIRRG